VSQIIVIIHYNKFIQQSLGMVFADAQATIWAWFQVVLILHCLLQHAPEFLLGQAAAIDQLGCGVVFKPIQHDGKNQAGSLERAVPTSISKSNVTYITSPLLAQLQNSFLCGSNSARAQRKTCSGVSSSEVCLIHLLQFEILPHTFIFQVRVDQRPVCNHQREPFDGVKFALQIPRILEFKEAAESGALDSHLEHFVSEHFLHHT
jgi:hypothetical protein